MKGNNQKKVYYLYSERPSGMWSNGIPEDVGQFLVKEAWLLPDPAHAEITDPGAREKRQLKPATFYALFMMWRETPETPNTDDGWIYATVIPNNDESDPQAWTITEVGAIESCIKCHEDAPGGGRVFGLTH